MVDGARLWPMRGVGGGIWNGVLQLSGASGGEACQMQVGKDEIGLVTVCRDG